MQRTRIFAAADMPPKSMSPRMDVRGLLQGGREAVLLHGQEEYRLRLTQSGKLILTK